MSTSTSKKTLSDVCIVPVQESINKLMACESKYIPVASVCNEYQTKLNSGKTSEQICEQFVADLSKVASHNKAKDILFNVNSSLKRHKRDVEISNCITALKESQYAYVAPSIENVLVEYMVSKNSETRKAAREIMSLFENVSEIKKILEMLSYDEYDENNGREIYNVKLNESAVEQPKTYTAEEVEKIVEQKLAKQKAAAAKEKEKPATKTIRDIDTTINLTESINRILAGSHGNEKVRIFCEQYVNALNSGKIDEALVESFISGISNYNYLSAVDTEVSSLKDRVAKYRQDVDLKKIVETMKETSSYFIVPLIEDVLVEYMSNKSMQNRALLKNRLTAFEYDPFVRDILTAVNRDMSIESNVYLGESVEELNKNVRTENIFSPIEYIKENECIFNVKGHYYSKKGNSITKLSKKSVSEIDESFKNLCSLLNSSNVRINEDMDQIHVYFDSDVAIISESAITLNGNDITTDELNSIANASMMMNEHKEKFYSAVKMINENFGSIAHVDFVKRVSCVDGSRSVDVFKLKNNIFVNAIDESLNTSTFYRNVNPIQCKNYINEHMQINVSKLFEDVLPEQEEIEKEVKDTREQYTQYLDNLRQKKQELEDMKNESSNTEDIDNAIKMVDDEIDSVQADFDKYKEDTDKIVKIDGTEKDSDKNPSDDKDTTDSDDDKDGEFTDPETGEEIENPETPEEMETPMTGDTDSQDFGNSDQTSDGSEDTFGNNNQSFDTDSQSFDTDSQSFDTDSQSFDTDGQSFDTEDQSLANAEEYDGTFDTVSSSEDASFQVVKVSYSENVKTGKKSGKGDVFIIVPSVNANGDICNETKKVTFYLDANRVPVINNEYMPLDMYYAIKDAIESDPATQTVELDGETSGQPTDTTLVMAELPSEETVTSDDNGDVTVTDTYSNPDVSAVTFTDTTIDTDDDEDVDTYGNTEDTNDTAPGDAARQESPAETADSEDSMVNYPVDVHLDPKDIKPIKQDSFEGALDDMGIKHGQSESVNGGICFTVANKSEAHALKDYFNEWKGYNTKQFCNFFPELKKCFANKQSTIPVMEGVRIKNVFAVNESVLFRENKKGRTSVVLPNTKDYRMMFDLNENFNADHISISTDNFAETKSVYESLARYNYEKGGKIDEDAKSFLAHYAKDFDGINEAYATYTITVPYNNFLSQKLSGRGINAVYEGKKMKVMIRREDFKKAAAVFESFYKKSTPAGVKKFIKAINEGVKIIVKDDATGKTVEIDTSDLNGSVESQPESSADFEKSFKDTTTFDATKSELYKDTEEDADESKDSKEDNPKEDKKKDKEKESDVKEGEETPDVKKPEKSDDSAKSAPSGTKKKFKFRLKKRTNESVYAKTVNQILNESVVNVYDNVKLKNGKKGQVISKFPNGNYIVNVEGHTVECNENELTLTDTKLDTVAAPFKFDEKTLKGLYEQMVHCGMFMNGNQITPNDCYVKYSDYISAPADTDISIIIEGERVFASKRFIRILEDVNSFANINDYVKGTYVAEGVSSAVLANRRDFGTSACRILINEGDKCVLRTVPSESVIIEN